jgi:tetratricopeptide (TPR) repeat protein
MKQYSQFTGRSFWTVVILLAAATAVFAARSSGTQNRTPLNSQLTSQAWQSLNKGDYRRAIESARKCIDEFRDGANRAQAQLEKEHAPLPPVGKVLAADKKIILARGLLNDVATCFFIMGRAAEYLGRKEDAKQSYQAASKYTYARCWDPKGWFWSPAEVASDRLSRLQ